jgi:hypothetical protein
MFVYLQQNKKGRKLSVKGVKSGVVLLERMKHGYGIKDREDKSSGIEFLIVKTFANVSQTH